jgi:hypothetical protein
VTHASWQPYASVVQILTGVLTVIVLFLSLRTTRQLKKADVLIETHRRYDGLLASKDSLMTGDAEAQQQHLTSFFERFWKLQDDEFYSWREGLIGDKVYRDWIDTASGSGICPR